jgi:hypothetical protein
MRLIADIYDRPSVDFRSKADLAALASGRFAPEAALRRARGPTSALHRKADSTQKLGKSEK